nr:hypothetical protein [Tanacetum cinerariifolium]
IWAFLMFSSSNECACASGAISSSICEEGKGVTCDDPEALGDPKVLDGSAGGGGGGG